MPRPFLKYCTTATRPDPKTKYNGYNVLNLTTQSVNFVFKGKWYDSNDMAMIKIQKKKDWR